MFALPSDGELPLGVRVEEFDHPAVFGDKDEVGLVVGKQRVFDRDAVALAQAPS